MRIYFGRIAPTALRQKWVKGTLRGNPSTPMMMHSFSTLGCPELDLDGVVALAARHGFHAVELRALCGRLDLPTLFAEKFGTPEKWADYLKARRIRVCVLDTSFKLIGATEAERAELLDYVRWADAADVMWLRVLDGGKEGTPEEIAEAVATMNWWRELRLKNFWAVDLLVEPYDALATNPALKEFLSKVPFASLLWDSHRTWRRGGENPLETWKIVRGRTEHIHVKDSVSKPSEKHPYTYVMPGEGEFPMASLRDALASDRFGGVVSLEWNRYWHPYLPELDKALHAAARTKWW